MATLDYQAQLTLIYDKLSAIQADLAKLAIWSNVSDVQASLQAQMNTIAARVGVLTTEVETIQLTMSDLLIELRSK